MSDAPEIPQEIQELNPELFRSWKHSPMTAIFRSYLADFRAALIRDHGERWIQNNELPAGGEDEARFRAAVIQDILDLEPETIRQFYGVKDDAEEIEQAIQDQPKVQEEEV